MQTGCIRPVVFAAFVCWMSLVATGCGDALFGPPPPRDFAEDDEEGPTLEVDSFHSEPAAVGATKSYDVSTVIEEVSFRSITVERDSDAVRVVSKNMEDRESPEFVVRGGRAGDYSLEVYAELDSGQHLRDEVEFRVRTVERVDIEPTHVYTPEDYEKEGEVAAPYLTDSVAQFEFELHGADDERLVSKGLYPVDWRPKDALELDRDASKKPGSLVFRTGSQPSGVTLESARGDGRTRIQLIDASMVQDLRLLEREITEDIDDLSVRGPWSAHIAPVYRDVALLDGSLDISLTSETPDVCEVVTDDARGLEQSDNETVKSGWGGDWNGNYFGVDVERAGDCTLRARLASARDSQGVERTWTIAID